MTSVGLPWIAPSRAATPSRELPPVFSATAAPQWVLLVPSTEAAAVLNPIRHNAPERVVSPPRARR